ncbi:SafA/ExsA family spore coat assembly protein [Domibacillus robiginosus]|uniref:SafA/ExsA family spore coat assembly protein n=1 Tax=Domibacillus robiginosus TaxID=1071054 RepID=UPI00067C5E78|nr:SafA/ExsA family spore coat assembly protein [Domibacillus robiginosus]
MKKIIAATLLTVSLMPSLASAATTYTVQSGDTMWKIASKYKVGTSEIITANPSVKNPNTIYPGQKLNIPTVSTNITNMEEEVVRLVNIERQKAGLKPLTQNWELSRVARIKSQDMMNNHYFSHNSPTYGTPFNMMKNFGITYKSAGENIAQGQTTPAAVMKAWMNSAGHKANILNSNFTQIGVGYEPNGNYWTQQFIQK